MIKIAPLSPCYQSGQTVEKSELSASDNVFSVVRCVAERPGRSPIPLFSTATCDGLFLPMSLKMMTTVWEMDIPSLSGKMVLLKLADNANDQGQCFPSIKTLSRTCQLSENGVRNQIKKLQTMGLLLVHNGGGRKSNEYTVLPKAPLQTVHPSIESDPCTDCRAPLHGLQGTPARIAGHPCTDCRAPLQTVQGTPAQALQGTPAQALHPNHNITVIEPPCNHHVGIVPVDEVHEAIGLWIKAFEDEKGISYVRRDQAKFRKEDEKAMAELIGAKMTAQQIKTLASSSFRNKNPRAYWSKTIASISEFAKHIMNLQIENPPDYDPNFPGKTKEWVEFHLADQAEMKRCNSDF